MIPIATQFGPYTLNWLIGRGGMGDVHNAFDSRHNRYVALKLLSREVSDDEELATRFRHEAQIVATLRHPHVIPVHGFGEIDGRLYLDMRLVDGSDLATLLEAGPLSAGRAVAILEQVAGALEAAHDEGLVHRDVKPSNVLVARGVGGEDFAYLVDFGIARSVDAPTVTRAEHPVGTLAYMAPERFRGARPAVSGDIYALTCLLYECLTGRRPFDDPTLPALLHAHLDQRPPKPSARNPTLGAFDPVIAKGLAKDPARRYRTATELALAARQALEHDGTQRFAGSRRSGLRGGRLSPRVLASVAGVALLFATSAVVVARTGRDGADTGTSLNILSENSVGMLDPVTGQLKADLGVDPGPGAVAEGFGAIWTANTNADSVSRIDQTSRVVTRIPVGTAPSAVAVGAGSVWVANSGSGSVSRIDPGTGRTQTINVGTQPGGVAVAQGAAWVSNTADATVMRIDPAQNKVVKTIPVGDGPSAIAGGNDVWVANSRSDNVSQIDPSTSSVVRIIPVGRDPEGIQAIGDHVWVANNLDGTVSRIAATGISLTTLPRGPESQPTALSEAGGSLWVASTGAKALYEFDVAKTVPRLLRSIPLGVEPTGVTTTGAKTTVWVTGGIDPTHHRGGVLHLRGPRPGTIDPTYNGTKTLTGLLNATYDGLVGYRHANGSKGAEIVADLASAVPQPTDGGRTYVFRLRPGIRWSDGRTVTVFDVRRGFERAVVFAQSSGQSFAPDEIVGASPKSCSVTSCDITGIAVDSLAGTVTVHLVRADPAFLDKVAAWCPVVPDDTPLAEQKAVPVPGTGPYQISNFVADRSFALTPNTYFTQWSAAAQPRGFPESIEYEMASSASPVSAAESRLEAANVQAGLDDWSDARQVGPLDALRSRFGDRLHVTQTAGTSGIYLNTRIPPFSDERVRRALNFAVDRHLVAAAWITPSTPTCQILPPNFPGYRPNCPYTLHPALGSGWDAPDIVTAQNLVAASHTTGMPVTLWSPTFAAPAAAEVVKALKELGYRANLKIGEPRSGSGQQVQGGWTGWRADYFSPADFIVALFACSSISADPQLNTNKAQFCDPATEALIQRAEQLESTSRAAANDVWTDADQRITYASAWIPLVNETSVDTVSPRVHNYLRNPALGVLFDQMWVL